MFMKKKSLFQDVLKINNLNKKLQYFNDVYDYFSKYMLKSLSIYQKQFCPAKKSFATIKKIPHYQKVLSVSKKFHPIKKIFLHQKFYAFLNITFSQKKISLKIKMEGKQIFFKQLDLDEENRFKIDLNSNKIIERLKFSTHRKYSVTNLKTNANIETAITKGNNYSKICELSDFC